MTVSPFLSSLKPLKTNADRQFVEINRQKVEQAAEHLVYQNELKAPAWRSACYPQTDDLESLAWYFLTHGSINFAFANFKPPFKKYFKEYKGQKWEGSRGMAAALTSAVYDHKMPIFNADYLSQIDAPELWRVFAPEEIPLLEERAANLRRLGSVLLEKYNGEAPNVFLNSDFFLFGENGENGGFIERLITDFKEIFQDISWHRRSASYLQFHKLANLIPILWQGRALDSSGRLPRFKDTDMFYPPADYSVPKSLEAIGILKYSGELSLKIGNSSLIERDSPEEQEIRAATVWAMFELLGLVNEVRSGLKKETITMAELDGNIWLMARSISKPHHLTITTAY